MQRVPCSQERGQAGIDLRRGYSILSLSYQSYSRKGGKKGYGRLDTGDGAVRGSRGRGEGTNHPDVFSRVGQLYQVSSSALRSLNHSQYPCEYNGTSGLTIGTQQNYSCIIMNQVSSLPTSLPLLPSIQSRYERTSNHFLALKGSTAPFPHLCDLILSSCQDSERGR